MLHSNSKFFFPVQTTVRGISSFTISTITVPSTGITVSLYFKYILYSLLYRIIFPETKEIEEKIFKLIFSEISSELVQFTVDKLVLFVFKETKVYSSSKDSHFSKSSVKSQ